MLNIMLVEDDEVDVMAVQRMFRKHYVLNPLHVAANGLEALTVLYEQNDRSSTFQEHLLILLDFYMPNMNGLEFLAELQLSPDFKEIPVITFVTSDVMKFRMETNYSNIVGCLGKPFIFSDLTEIVKLHFADSATLNLRFNKDLMLS